MQESKQEVTKVFFLVKTAGNQQAVFYRKDLTGHMTFIQRRLNVDATSKRLHNVASTSM